MSAGPLDEAPTNVGGSRVGTIFANRFPIAGPSPGAAITIAVCYSSRPDVPSIQIVPERIQSVDSENSTCTGGSESRHTRSTVLRPNNLCSRPGAYTIMLTRGSLVLPISLTGLLDENSGSRPDPSSPSTRVFRGSKPALRPTVGDWRESMRFVRPAASGVSERISDSDVVHGVS